MREIPLLYQNREIGRLQVAPRRTDERFSDEDERLLAAIAQLSATTVHAAQQTMELQHSRQMLITSREEERRRLRRDLHDGLGPVLAAVALQADTARDLAGPDQAVMRTLLDSITEQAQMAVADIRRVVHGLRPPTLDELGLVAALRQSARAYRHQLDIQIVAEEMPPLPAAVEVAAFHIAREAVTNVVKHAQAQVCIVTVSLNGNLRMMVEDDGIGCRPDAAAGVGLISMRERAAELGGFCTIRSRASGGTRVEVVLPLVAGEV